MGLGASDHLVFVSYAHEDETIVRRLVDDLSCRGLPAWFAPREIRLGHSIDAAITRAIDSARFVFVACSKPAMSSPWVASEVAYAIDREARTQAPRVVPIYLVSDDVPLALRERLAVDLRESRYEAGVDRLIDELLHGRMPQGIVPLAGFRQFVDQLPIVSVEIQQQLDRFVLRARARGGWVTSECTIDELQRAGIPVEPAELERRHQILARLEQERRADEVELDRTLSSTQLVAEARRNLVERTCAGGLPGTFTSPEHDEIVRWLRKGPSRECLAMAANLFGFSASGQASGSFTSSRIKQVREGWSARGEVALSTLPSLERFIDELLRLDVIERVRTAYSEATEQEYVFGRVLPSVGKAAYLYEADALQGTTLSPVGRLEHIERD